MLSHLIKQSLLEKSLGKILLWPKSVLVCICLITTAAVWQLPNLSFKTSVYDLAIQDLPETQSYERFKSVFGSDEIIRLVIKSDNLFEPVTFSKIIEISEMVSGVDGIKQVISLPVIKQTIDVSGKRSLEQFSGLIATVELFEKNLISTDGTTTVFTLILDGGANKEMVIQSVGTIIEQFQNHLFLYQIGMPLVSEALTDFTKKDFFRLPPVTFILIAAILYLLFKSLLYLLLPLSCVCLSLIWTFGLMALLRIPLSMLTMIVPVFLIAVGTAYCIYIASEFVQCRQRIDSHMEAVFLSFYNMTLPTILAVLTTCIGLGSLMVNKITAIREFALFSGFGILSLLVVVLTFFPAALILWPPPEKNDNSPDRHLPLMDYFLELIIRINLNHQKPLFVIIAVLVIFSGFGISKIAVETNPIDYLKGNTEIRQNFNAIYQDLSGCFPINIVMESEEEDFFESPENIKEIERLQAYLETVPGIDKTISFADYLKLVNYYLNAFDPEYYALPGEGFEARMLINNYRSILKENMFNRFMNPELSKTNILLLTHISSSKTFLETKNTIIDHVTENFSNTFHWDVTGFGIVIASSSHLLISGQVKSLFLTLGLIFIIMLLLFLSVKVGFIGMIASCFPILINFGIMGWLGIELSVATALIACIAIGLAVDDIIHYLVRYNGEFKNDLDKDRAMGDTIRAVGKPILFTTLTIIIGFSILMFSHFSPTSVFGFLMVITMLAALIGDLLILPSLIIHVELVTAWDLLRLMPTMGGISSEIAHELNQPLTVINMGSKFLRKAIKSKKGIKEEELLKIVDEMSEQLERASEIVARLSRLTESPCFQNEKVNVNESINDAVAIIRHQLYLDNIDIKLSLQENIPEIIAHNHRISQVIYNLLTNARDAIDQLGPSEGRGSIALVSSERDGWVRISITDSGVGMPPSNIERIMEPFFTTKEVGKGKGLGLAISNQIVKSYGGRIQVKSREGSGSSFILRFPVGLSLCHSRLTLSEVEPKTCVWPALDDD